MSDFTKEELEIIHLDMETYVTRKYNLIESESHKELREKVKSMIDGYCEDDGNKCEGIDDDIHNHITEIEETIKLMWDAIQVLSQRIQDIDPMPVNKH